MTASDLIIVYGRSENERPVYVYNDRGWLSGAVFVANCAPIAAAGLRRGFRGSDAAREAT